MLIIEWKGQYLWQVCSFDFETSTYSVYLDKSRQLSSDKLNCGNSHPKFMRRIITGDATRMREFEMQVKISQRGQKIEPNNDLKTA